MGKRIRRLRRILTAWMLGIRDGWEQPHDLSTSTNVDYLLGEGHDDLTVHDALDRGINLGQILRIRASHGDVGGGPGPAVTP